MKLPDLKKLLQKKEPEEKPAAEPVPSRSLPQEFERFKVERPPAPQTPSIEERYGSVPERPRTEPTPYGGLAPGAPAPYREGPAAADRIDMILQKLETIDTRLKLLEEKMR